MSLRPPQHHLDLDHDVGYRCVMTPHDYDYDCGSGADVCVKSERWESHLCTWIYLYQCIDGGR
jgi:hypothetical protein